MESRHLFVVVAGGNSVLDRNRAVLESNFVLGVVAGCRLEGERGLHSICANHGTFCCYYQELMSATKWRKEVSNCHTLVSPSSVEFSAFKTHLIR